MSLDTSLDASTQPGTGTGTGTHEADQIHESDGTAASPSEGSAASSTPVGGRVQLALNVRDIDAAVDFYGKLFGAEPAKRRPGYANFAIARPPLKLVLIEDPTARGDGVTGALNHLGVEVATTEQVGAATQRLTGEGLATLTQDATSCCYAVQDKVWVHDPDGAPWEVYTVLADAPSATIAGTSSCTTVDGTCVPTDTTATTGAGAAGGLQLSTHGVPVATSTTATTGTTAPTTAAAPIMSAGTTGTTPAAACCDTATAGSCCEPSSKASCCGDATAATGALPATCGCS